MSVDGHCLIWTCKSCSCLESGRERDDRWVGGWRRRFFCICTCIVLCICVDIVFCTYVKWLVVREGYFVFVLCICICMISVGGWVYTIHHSSMCCVPTVLVDGRWCWQKGGSGASDRFSMDCSQALPTLFAKLCLISCLFAKLCAIIVFFAKKCILSSLSAKLCPISSLFAKLCLISRLFAKHCVIFICLCNFDCL